MTKRRRHKFDLGRSALLAALKCSVQDRRIEKSKEDTYASGSTPERYSWLLITVKGTALNTLRVKREPKTQTIMCTTVNEMGYCHSMVWKMYLFKMTVVTVAPSQAKMRTAILRDCTDIILSSMLRKRMKHTQWTKITSIRQPQTGFTAQNSANSLHRFSPQREKRSGPELSLIPTSNVGHRCV